MTSEEVEELKEENPATWEEIPLPTGVEREARKAVMFSLQQLQGDEEANVIWSKWVSCNKNDINDHNVRSRLVAL